MFYDNWVPNKPFLAWEKLLLLGSVKYQRFYGALVFERQTVISQDTSSTRWYSCLGDMTFFWFSHLHGQGPGNWKPTLRPTPNCWCIFPFLGDLRKAVFSVLPVHALWYSILLVFVQSGQGLQKREIAQGLRDSGLTRWQVPCFSCCLPHSSSELQESPAGNPEVF